jgi:hypothetical protein
MRSSAVDWHAFEMTLRLDPTAFSRSDQQNQTVRSGEWLIGRIWEDGDSEDLRWYWSLFASISGPQNISRIGRAATFEKAKEQLGDNWSKLLAWAGLTESS